MKNAYTIKTSFANCPKEARKKFDQATAVLLISVGQAYHEGLKFESTLELISRKFKSYYIIVGDTLQRHNISSRLSVTEENALKISVNEGNEWLKRNQSVIEKHDNCGGIMRWSSYLSDPCFLQEKEKIELVYKTNKEFKFSVDTSINEYLERCGLTQELQRAKAKKVCLRYIIEECSGMLIWANDGYQYEVYPRKRNDAMQFVWENLIKPVYGNVLNPVALRFKKKFVKQEGKIRCAEND